MILELILGCILAACVGLVIYARWNYGVLEGLGITVVGKPWLIFGNTWNAYDKPGPYIDIERFKEFGSVFGVYEGRSPHVFIAEGELIRLITTKDAEYFNNKRQIDFRNEIMDEMPDFQPYDKWKAIRSFLTPAFSSAKLRLMSEGMVASCQKFCNNMASEVKSCPGGKKLENVDLRLKYFNMITEMIARCCFSVQIENPNDPHNIFVNIVRGLLSPESMGSPKLEILSYSFPFLTRFLPGMFDRNKPGQFKEIFELMMADRKSSGVNKKDIVDLCLEQMEKCSSPEYKKLGITDNTIVCQAFVFFFAGQDQISTISASLINYLLKNPSIQTQVDDELDSFLERHKGAIEYENISELAFLHACITETLRLVPFFHRTERVCTKDWENAEFGLKIKKGMVVNIPIWAANRNPKYFPNPESFNPSRWMDKKEKERLNSAYAFTSFGFGPRNCIGQKFSYDSLLLLNAHVLKTFKFGLRPDSEPVYVAGGPFFAPHAPFYFDVSLR